MAGIFISYRRADSDGWAGRLRDALRMRFGELVFQDVDNIADGEIFSDVIDRALQACDVALIIIGPTWANARDEQGRRRLDLEEDWVRTETAMVLNRKVRVIPVLVGGARLPRIEDLPEELRSLTKRQAREIRSTSWDSDVSLLAAHLQQIVGHPPRRVWLYAVPAVLVAAVLGIFAGGWLFGLPKSADKPEHAQVTPQPNKGKPSEGTPSLAAEASPSEPAKKPSAEPPPIAAKASPSEVAKAPSVEIPSRPDANAVANPGSAKASSVEIPSQPDSKGAAKRESAKAATQPSKPVSEKSPEVPRSSMASNAAPSDELIASKRGKRAEPRDAAGMEARPAEANTAEAVASSQPPPRRQRTEPATSAENRPETAPVDRSASAAPESGATNTTVAKAASISLPNRPASARELKVGDSWTYRLTELTYNKNLATVTHEIRGGDASGIREVVRVGGPRSGADGDGAGTPRRLPLEPRVFEQQIGTNATLFEFAPFMLAFSDVRPGVSWSKIADDSPDEWQISGKVTGREQVRTAAGTFDAIKAELRGRRELTFPPTRDVYNDLTVSQLTYSIWYVPEVGRAVKYERRTFNRAARLLEHEQYELVSYQLK